MAFSSISNGLVRLLVLPPEPGTAPRYSSLRYFRCWHLPVLYSLQCRWVGSEAEACGSWSVFLSWRNPKAFQPTFYPFLLFFKSVCTRLLPIQPFLLCCPSLTASVLPPSLFPCGTDVCHVHLYGSLQLSPQNLTCIPISPGMLPYFLFKVHLLIRCTLSLCQSQTLSHACGQGTLTCSGQHKWTFKFSFILVLDLSVTGISHKYKHPGINIYCILST